VSSRGEEWEDEQAQQRAIDVTPIVVPAPEPPPPKDDPNPDLN
jgi:hypothetical protein